jgi:hypothetical protein
MMLRSQVEALDARKRHWAAAVEAPTRDWVAAPGCRRHARFLVDEESMAPSRERFIRFDSRAECLAWIMAHRRELNEHMPGGKIHAVLLTHWLLGLE